MHVLVVCKHVIVCKCMWDTCVSVGVSQYVVCVVELHFVFEYNTCFVKRCMPIDLTVCFFVLY